MVDESHRRSTIKEVGHSQPTTVKTNATKEVIVAGTKAGGKKAAATNKEKYGSEFYANIGRKGGQNGHTGGFAANPELARIAGAKGGTISKRGPSKNPRTPHLSDKEYALGKTSASVRDAAERRRLKAEIRALEAEEEW